MESNTTSKVKSAYAKTKSSAGNYKSELISALGGIGAFGVTEYLIPGSSWIELPIALAVGIYAAMKTYDAVKGSKGEKSGYQTPAESYPAYASKS